MSTAPGAAWLKAESDVQIAKRFVLLLVLILSGLCDSAFAEDKPPPLPAAKAAFAKADQELNRAWTAVKKALDETEFDRLKDAQKAWIAYRDRMALVANYTGRPPDEKAAQHSPEYYSFLADLTILEDCLICIFTCARVRSQWIAGHSQ